MVYSPIRDSYIFNIAYLMCYMKERQESNDHFREILSYFFTDMNIVSCVFLKIVFMWLAP